MVTEFKYQNKNGFAEENALFDDRLSNKMQKYLFFFVSFKLRGGAQIELFLFGEDVFKLI